MEFIKNPAQIENRSMEIIAPYIANLNLSFEETKIYSRIIHAAGDVEYAPSRRSQRLNAAEIFLLMLKWCGRALISGR